MNSVSKAKLSALRKLGAGKGRAESGLFLVEGVRLCEALAETELEVGTVLITPERYADARGRTVAEKLAARGAELLEAAEWQIEKISDTVHSQGILAAARRRELSLAEISFGRQARVLALDRVSDPGNVGAVIRAAAWFGTSAVLLGEGCADLLNPKTVRATMGGLFHVPVVRDLALCEVVEKLLPHGFSVSVAAVDGNADWQSWCVPDRSLLILGSEAHGVAPGLRALAGQAYTIPRTGAGESLNVAVSAGIFLSALQRGENQAAGCPPTV